MGTFLAWMILGAFLFIGMPVIFTFSIALCVQLFGFFGVIPGVILAFAIVMTILTWVAKQ